MRHTLTAIFFAVFCLAVTINLAQARPAPEVGARIPGSRIAAGFDYTCGVNADGTVRCWGLNQFGQLGDGTTTTRLTPVQVSGLTNVLSVAAGNLHTCALLADGTVRCWGDN